MTWSLTEDGVLTITGSGAMWDYVKPFTSRYDCAPWYDYAHGGCIRKLVFSGDITHIGSCAFYGGLSYPTIFGELTDWTFSLELPQGLRTIGDYAFYEAKLLKDVVIPESVTDIGDYAFSGIWKNSRGEPDLEENPEKYCGTLTMPSKWPRLGEGAFCDSNLSGELRIPEGVTDIPDKAFSYTCFSALTLPESIRHIGEEAFCSLWITELKLPAQQPDMGKDVFSGCYKITELVIPEAWTSIPDGMCDSWGSLTRVSFPAGLKEIGDYSFAYCKSLSSIAFPAGLERIGYGAFCNCENLTYVALPAGLKFLETWAFAFSGLTAQPAWPSGLEEVGGYIYYYCENMTGTGTFPSGVGYSGTGLFRCTKISSAILADDMAVIPDQSFYSCDYLTKVYVPASVTAVHGTAFYGKSKLNDIYYEGTREDWDAIQFVDVPYGKSSYSKTIIDRVINNGGLHCLGTKRPESTEKPVYKGTTGKRLIRVMVPGSTGYPQPGDFTVQTADQTLYETGSKNYVSVELDKTAPGSITVSGEGYHSYTLPEELVGSTGNVISLYPTTWEGPFAQAVLLDKSSGSFKSFNNLLSEGAVFYLGDPQGFSRSLYVDVNWNGSPEGSVSLWQSNEKQLSLHQGFNTGLPLSRHFDILRPIYLMMETGGQRYIQELKLSVMMRAASYNLDLGESVTETRIPEQNPNTNENVDVFGGQTLKLDFKKLLGKNMPVSLEVSANGTVKDTIGIKLGSKDAKGASYDSIKEAIDELNDSGAGIIPSNDTRLSKLLDENLKKGLVPEASVASVGISGEVQVLGYIEGFYDYVSGRMELAQIGCALAFKGSASYTQTYMISTVPMYFTAAVKGGVEQAMNMFMDANSNTLMPGKETMKVSFSITLENGVGYPKLLTVGLAGSGSFTVIEELPHEPGEGTWILNAKASVNLGAVGFGQTLTVWKSDNLTLYKDGVVLPDSRAASLSLQSLEDLEWTKVSRDFLEEPSVFAINDRVSLLAETSGAVTESPFKSNVYPYAEPRLITRPQSSDTLALWLDAGSGDRTTLYYSVYDSVCNEWGAPRALDEVNLTGSDFAPTVWMDESGNIFIAWCRTADDSTLVNAANSLDICVTCMPVSSDAPLDTQVVCRLDGTDMLPAIGMAGGKLRVAWVHSPGGIFAAAGQAIYTVDGVLTKDGSDVTAIEWGQPALAADELGSVDALTVDTSGDVWFSQDSDGSGARSLYRLRNGAPVLEKQNACKPSVHNGSVWYYNTADGTVDSVLGESFPAVAGSDWYRWMEKSNTLVTLGHDENGASVLYASYRGAPLTELTSTGNCVVGIDASERADGSIAILANLQTLGEDGAPSRGDLMFYRVTAGTSASITDLSYDPDTMVSGGLLTVSAAVENRGSETIRYFRVRSGAEDFYMAQTLGCGESGILSFDLALPEELPETIGVTITPCGIEQEGTPSSLEVSLRLADVSLEDMYVQPAADGAAETTLRVVNRGQTTLENITVSLHADAADGGPAADSQTVSVLAPGDVATLTFLTPAEKMGKTALLYAVAEPEGILTENFRTNNTAFARLEDESAAGNRCTAYASAQRDGSSVQVAVDVENFSDTPCNDIYCAAVYQNGRMVAVYTAQPQTVAPGSIANVLSCTLPVPDGDLEVKVFTLDSDSRPAAAEQSFLLQEE